MNFKTTNISREQGLVRSLKHVFVSLIMFGSLSFASSAYALVDFDYPYFNDFESVTSQHDDSTDTDPGNDINGQADWDLSNDWGMAGDHTAWTSYQGGYHLDNNPLEVDQNGHNVDQTATMNAYLNIPLNSSSPSLTYAYKANLLHPNDVVSVELQVEGAPDWTVLKTYSESQNRSVYTWDELDLSAYKGQSIRVRFVQMGYYTPGPRLFVVDNLSIADLSLQQLSYPYINGFETASEQSVWRLSGLWEIATNHNAWTSNTGVRHLDNNPQEIDQQSLYYEQNATLDGYISIPVDSTLPTLSYAYKLNLLHYNDKVVLRIQEQGSDQWIDIRAYHQQHNRSDYVFEELDLSAYKGKTIRIQFWQESFSIAGPRLFVLDDFSIADRSLPQLAFPYQNAFESAAEKQDWRLSGTWNVATDHNSWTSNAGVGHLDNNPLEEDQYGYIDFHTAEMNGFVSIPQTSVAPVVRYAYKLNLLNYSDQVKLEVQVEGSAEWISLKDYYEQHNHDTYTVEEIDLSAYKGQNIRLRFYQGQYWTNGARLFVADDFSIAESNLPQQVYPYYNSFETIDEQGHWSLVGSWGIAADHGGWTSHNGQYHLDNNIYEVDQYKFTKDITATLDAWVNIPLTSQVPVLSYYYRLEQTSAYDEIYLEIQEQGVAGWNRLKLYNKNQFVTNGYALERIPLDAYRGKNIRIRFRQQISTDHGPRLIVIDDLSIDDLNLDSYVYPYSNAFETVAEQQQWRSGGTWGISGDHDVNWTSKAGLYHLDNNRNAVDQGGHYKDHFAEMEGFVTIPVDSVKPVLEYDYKITQLRWDDQVDVKLQVQGSGDWIVLGTYYVQHDRTSYTHEQIDLSAWRGQSVRIAFVQSDYWDAGTRLFVVDNVRIDESQLPLFSYPFTAGFETAAEQQQWRTAGTWNIAPAGTSRPNLGGSYHMDNNPGEVDQAENVKGHYALMEGYVEIPMSSVQPVLSYGYQQSMIHANDEVFVKIQTLGSSDWVQLRIHSQQTNHPGYTYEELSLAAYRGQKIRIGFFQKHSLAGVRIFLLDDLRIGDLQLSSLNFPYQTGFDDPLRNTEWTLQGVWSLAAAHNSWTSASGTYHLDGNAAEQDLRLFKSGHTASLNGFVTVPVASGQPVVNFKHQLFMAGIEAVYFIEIQVAGTDDWNALKTWRNADNTSSYSLQEISLDAYKGQAIRIRFRQDNQWDNGPSVWTIDDFNIIDLAGVVIDTDGDGVPDASDAFPNDPTEWSDQDGDGVGDNADVFPTDPTESADLDNDGIGDNSDPDRDGDATDNGQDSYPDDPTRFQLSAVQNVAISQQTTQLRISWDAHEETGVLLQGYNVYRADYNLNNWLQINGALVTDTTFVDNTVQNGQTYQYRVEAVDINAIVGASSASISHFLIYNTIVIDPPQYSWQNYHAQLAWTHTLQAQESYRLYRMNGGVRTLVYEGVNTQYLDDTTVWNQAYSYELVSVLTFNNAISTQDESVEGPVASIQVAQQPAIQLSLTGAQSTGSNQFLIEADVGGQLTLTGQYQNAVADLALSLSSSQGTLNTTSTNGAFQFVLRDLQAGSMTLTLVENGAPASRTVTATINVTADQTPLALSIDGPASVTTSASNIIVEGDILNADKPVQSISASNSRYGSQPFGLSLLANNRFAGEVPLQNGDNSITVQAINSAGESAVANLQVTRQASLIPSVVFTSHQNNQTVTSDRIDMSGVIYTSQSLNQIKLSLNNQTAIVTEQASQQYGFVLSQVNLNQGYNRLVALTETPAGNVETAIVIYYNDGQAAEQAPLDIRLSAPADNQAIKDDLLIVRGQLFNVLAGNENTASVVINGESTQLTGSAATGLSFSHAITGMSQIADASYPVTIQASAQDQAMVEETLNLVIDRLAPTITLNNTLLAQPNVNEVREVPYVISGTVVDTHLVGVSINGQGLVLQPANGVDSYSFSTGLNMSAGVTTPLTISAVDTAGNATTLSYSLISSPQASIEIVEPLAQAEITTSGASFPLDYITRITGLSPADQAVAQLVVIAGSSQQSLAISQSVMAGAININTSETIDQLRFEVRDDTNQLLASKQVDITLINGDNIPIQLEATEPASNEQYYQPHYPIKFYFNRPVDSSLATVIVKETFHGKTYASETLSGAQLDQVYKGELVEVHRDQADVAGGLSLVPGEQILEFYPQRDLAYGATVTVSIDYNGQNLKRFNYKVRPAPTFVIGTVANQLQQPLQGIEVSLPELGLVTTTNKDGVFSFGQGLKPEDNIPSGNYRLLVNADHGDPALATREQLISVAGGQKNDGYSAVVPVLDPNLKYQYMRSGTAQNILAGGDLLLDTTGMRLQFPGGAEAGKVHVQMSHFAEATYASNQRTLLPLWVYQLQPTGIRLFESVPGSSPRLEISMPSLYGSDDYIPPDGTLVVLMGTDEETLKLSPIGVGRISNKKVVSAGDVHISRLDTIGYSFVPGEYQSYLEDYANGQISLLTLTGLLAQE